MRGRVPSTPSLDIDKQSPSLSGFRHLESFNTRDQQAYAASDALCALRQYQPPVLFEIDFSSNQSEGSLLSSQTPSSIGSYQDMSWSGGQPWEEPTLASVAPDQANLWTLNDFGHSTNSGPRKEYPTLSENTNQGYGIPVMMPLPAIDQISIPTQIQQRTPPSEILSEDPFDNAASSPPTELASRSSTDPGTSLDFEVINDSIAMIDHVDKSVEKMSDVPYAKLIERALLEAKGNRLVLKDIYKWIEENTDKARNPGFKGWQNSVRHNLSMNGAFTKAPLPASSKKSQKGFMWVLEPSAKEHGIQSTTRYRRKDETKRVGKRLAVDVRRERSARRGGRMLQKSEKLRILQTSERCSSLRYMKSDGLSLHGRPQFNPREQQYLAPSSSISAVQLQSYLPSPHLRSSFHDDASDSRGDFACVPPELALPLAPRS